jgi:hypothetical protein
VGLHRVRFTIRRLMAVVAFAAVVFWLLHDFGFLALGAASGGLALAVVCRAATRARTTGSDLLRRLGRCGQRLSRPALRLPAGMGLDWSVFRIVLRHTHDARVWSCVGNCGDPRGHSAWPITSGSLAFAASPRFGDRDCRHAAHHAANILATASRVPSLEACLGAFGRPCCRWPSTFLSGSGRVVPDRRRRDRPCDRKRRPNHGWEPQRSHGICQIPGRAVVGAAEWTVQQFVHGNEAKRTMGVRDGGLGMSANR